jgi:hypothetical protein
MTTASSQAPRPGLDGYLDQMQSGQGVLGHVVFFSIYDDPVTHADLVNWFRELKLDQAYLPNEPRPVDAAERVTGKTKVTYLLGDERPLKANGKRARKSRSAQDREATLMVRHVSRDSRQVVRHLIREVRDERAQELSYDPKMAECIFRRDQNPKAAAGAGEFGVVPNHAAIQALPAPEQAKVYECIDDMMNRYRDAVAFVSGDRLRELVRNYIEVGMAGVRLRPSGGVYFVSSQHDKTLAALYELVSRFNERAQSRRQEAQRSNLRRIPLPDQDEMRAMVAEEFSNQAKDALDQLTLDIMALRRGGPVDDDAVIALHRRFRELKQSSAEHAKMLSTSLSETEAALEEVNEQLAALLAGGDQDQDDQDQAGED